MIQENFKMKLKNVLIILNNLLNNLDNSVKSLTNIYFIFFLNNNSDMLLIYLSSIFIEISSSHKNRKIEHIIYLSFHIFNIPLSLNETNIFLFG